MNIADVIGGKQAVKELDLTYSELLNTQNIVVQKDSIIGQHQKKEVNFNGMLAEKDIQAEANKQVIKAQQKSIRTEKTKKNVNKIILGASIILNVFLAVKK